MAFVLVSGPNGSGKSIFAEQIVAQTEGRRFYIATMKPQTQDNFNRIEKHRKQREHLNFETLELPYELASAPIDGDSIVLLEDVSNLFANAYFEKHGSIDSVFEDILLLKHRCKMLIAVTISDLVDNGYNEETIAYINDLNSLNQRLFSVADSAYLMANGQAICVKGENHANS